MKYKKSVLLGMGLVGIFIVALFLLLNSPKEQPKSDNLSLDFTYDEANSALQESLKSKGISMSSPLHFQFKSELEKYCNFFKDEEKQKMVEYCTSTELKDAKGNFLGNIHMVGSSNAPGLVLVALQSNPLFENINDTHTVFETTTKELVCDCWEVVKPGGYESIASWMDALRDFHVAGKKPHSESNSIPLASKHIQIQLTTTTEGYEWRLYIAK